MLYIIRLSPGAQYDPAKRVWEQDLKAHTLYMLELLKRNILVMAGPIDESAGQFIILVHFPLPMKNIWDNVIYTCANTLVFEQHEQVDAWCKRHNMKKGEVVSLEKAWQFSKLWYGYYLDDDWKRKSPAFIRAIFEAVGLNGSFWSI